MWYIVYRKQGKHDVHIFNNHIRALAFARPSHAKIDTFPNDLLAIGTAIQSGLSYKVCRTLPEDDYTRKEKKNRRTIHRLIASK